MRKVCGLRNKKPAMARAAWRNTFNWMSHFCDWNLYTAYARWHRAAKGRK